MPWTVTRARSVQTRGHDRNESRPDIFPEGRLSLPLRTRTFDSERYPCEKETRSRPSLNEKMRGRFEDILIGPKQSFNAAGTLKEWQEERAFRLEEAAEEFRKKGRPSQEEEEPPLLYEILSGRRSSRAGDVVGVPSSKRGLARVETIEEEPDDDAGWLKHHPRQSIGPQPILENSRDYPQAYSSSGTWVESRDPFQPDLTSTPTQLPQVRWPDRPRPIAPLRGALKRSFVSNDEAPQSHLDYAIREPQSAFAPLPSRSEVSPHHSYQTSSPKSVIRRPLFIDDAAQWTSSAPQQSPTHQAPSSRNGYINARLPPQTFPDHVHVQQPNLYPAAALSDEFHTPPDQALPPVPRHYIRPPSRRYRSPSTSSDEYDFAPRKRIRRHQHYCKSYKSQRTRRDRERRRYRRYSNSSCSSCCSSSGYDTASTSSSPSASPVPRLMGVTDGAFANYHKPKPVTPSPKPTLPGRKARFAYQVEPTPRAPAPEVAMVQDQDVPSQSTEEAIQEFSDQEAMDTPTTQVALVAARASAMMTRAEEKQRREKRVRFDLSTIEEDNEEEGEMPEEGMQPTTRHLTAAPAFAPEAMEADSETEDDASSTDDDAWADENGVQFFADGGERGFNVWRDHY